MEEIAYRPQNVRETLVELKDTSELAVDLAYAAVLYRHAGLAEEVIELERRVSSLQYPAKISLMLAAKRADEAEQLVGIVQIVEAAVDITNAAADIAAIVLNGGLPEEVRAALPEADEGVLRAIVTEESELAGQTLADLSLETETGVRITAVRRGTDWLLIPDADSTLRVDDVIIGSGSDAGVDAVYEMATGQSRPVEPTPRTEVDELVRAANTIVELKNIAELAVGLGYSAVLFDDADLATEVSELEAQSDRLKTDIEMWVIEAGAQVGETARLPGMLRLAAASETICDAARSVADVVLREGDVHPVFGRAIWESDEVLTTTTVSSDGEAADRTLAELSVEERTGMSVMAIRRRDGWLFAPDGDTRLRANDVLITRGPREGLAQLRSLATEPPA